MEDKNKKAQKEPREKKIGIEILGPVALIISLISLAVAILNLLRK